MKLENIEDMLPKEFLFYGQGVSAGLAKAPVFCMGNADVSVPAYEITDTEKELSRFLSAHEKVVLQLQENYKRILQQAGEDAAEILDAYLEILEDDYSLIQPICQRIKSQRENAICAVDKHMNTVIEGFERIEQEYLRARADDAKDIKRQLIFALAGLPLETGLSDLNEPCIIAAHELAVTDTAQMDKQWVKGIVTETGGANSHAAILARSLGIPAIMGLKGILAQLQSGDMLLIDGRTGVLVVNPTPLQVREYSLKEQQQELHKIALENFRGRPTLSRDGHTISLLANIQSSEEAEKVIQADADGIGLFRSEFLYIDRPDLPGEEEQFCVYSQVLEIMGNRPVTIRTLDIGGDKPLVSMPGIHEENPFLGCRGVRFCLQNPQILLTQMCALLRAGVSGDLRVMIPMVTSIAEWVQVKRLWAEAERILTERKVTFKKELPLGIMVELPATAMMADVFAKEVDFFSVGTNDLTQYTLAVDRGNQLIADLYSVYEPSVMRLIDRTVRAAADAGISCSMCGEAAADPDLVPVFWGMGITSYSMVCPKVLEVRKSFSQYRIDLCQQLAKKIITAATREEVVQIVHEFLHTHNDLN